VAASAALPRLGLARKGIRSVVLEKASALGEIGAGIQLGPIAFHAFDYLGVGEAARGMAVYIDRLRAPTPPSATRSCAPKPRKIIAMIWLGCMAEPASSHRV
jgi:2-polyprenyl-6-methoxyphenol hydroxylase-like FAD-dependent oxidoreductase